MNRIAGIHHITAICGDPQTNVDFYVGLLGLRLVKRTVNFDDPATYHLYYGDGIGSPGTILTFFPWPRSAQGRIGPGQVTVTSFAIPPGALPFWQHRLRNAGVPLELLAKRFGDDVLSFSDPDGMQIELVTTTAALDPAKAYAAGGVPLEFAIHGFHSATLSEKHLDQTANLLQGSLGFKQVAQEETRLRFVSESGAAVDVVIAPDEPLGRVARGTVHHIAWRTPTDAQQADWLRNLTDLGYGVSPIMDRKYFHSIYFREPGGILFEIATDTPGFAVDESQDELGSTLVLPPWLESSRSQIEAALPRIYSSH